MTIGERLRELRKVKGLTLQKDFKNEVTFLYTQFNGDIINEKNYIGVNGLVYVTNKIYSPDDYVSVYGPVLFSNRTTVINWGIKKYLYHLYLKDLQPHGHLSPHRFLIKLLMHGLFLEQG